MMTSFAKLFSIFLALNSISTYRVARGFAPMRIESLSYHQRTPSSTRTASITEDLSHEEISRYSRHLVLSDVGVRGQKALKNASVLVIGAGGLGAPCLMYLAAAGIGHIGIVDGDVVDESNLQRQIIHGTSTVGLSKCESAARRIQDINPHVNVRQYEEEFTSETALRILGDGFSDKRRYDVVIDGSDNFPTKYLIK
jgi:adenylyltransferase/sulfurtransferase